MTDIYYIEDDPDIAGTVRDYLEKKNFRVTLLSTAAAAEKALDAHMPALVLIDWNLPDGRGDAVCRRIRTRFPHLPLIFLTVRGDSRDVVHGFQNGADDYVTKPFDLEVLHSRIWALLRRTGSLSEDYLSCGSIAIDCRRTTVFLGSEEITLSPAEYRLLLFLMRSKGRTVTRGQLLERLWDDNGNFVNDNTLTVTVRRLREKLGQPACLKTVRSIGYRMEDTI